MNQPVEGVFNDINSALQDTESVIHLDLSMSSYEVVPDEIRNFSNLRSLTLSCMTLPIPEWLMGLQTLQQLEIIQHDFEQIPDELLKIPFLERLSIGEVLKGNGIKRVEDNLLNCPNLRELELNFNPVEYISNNLVNHPSLESILISGDGNRLEYFPKLSRLKTLELEEFKMERLPAGLEFCTELEVLHLSHNHLKSIDLNSFNQLKDLRLNTNQIHTLKTDHITTRVNHLEIASNSLTQFPGDLKAFPELTELDLSHNDLTSFPCGLTDLKHLNTLNLRNNEIREIPSEIGNLSRLEHLNISKNMIRDIPESFRELSHLKFLDLSQNKLIRLPTFINEFSKLQTLNLSNNQLFSQPYSIPDSVGELCSLQMLDLGNNQLEFIPESMCEISLHRLDLSNNSVSFLPKDMSRWSGMKQLFLQNNPLIMISEEILQLKELTHLNLDHVSIMDWSEGMNAISRLPRLKSLSLRFNQMGSAIDLIKNLRHLEMLDLSRNLLSDQEKEEIYSLFKPGCRIYL
jgi:Leucine-rich repeat (LRR) protein